MTIAMKGNFYDEKKIAGTFKFSFKLILEILQTQKLKLF